MIQGSVVDREGWQLEKVVNLDENLWTPTKIMKKRSLRSVAQVDRVDVGPQ